MLFFVGDETPGKAFLFDENPSDFTAEFKYLDTLYGEMLPEVVFCTVENSKDLKFFLYNRMEKRSTPIQISLHVQGELKSKMKESIPWVLKGYRSIDVQTFIEKQNSLKKRGRPLTRFSSERMM